MLDHVGVGNPVAVAVNDPADPAVNVTLSADVIAGAWFTFNVKLCVASGTSPLAAVSWNPWGPPLPAGAVPANVSVPSP